ncbi:MAG: hypothetical protein ACTSU2_00685 [Promethearchaeota archaeon]
MPIEMIEFPEDYQFRFIKLFGDTPRVKVLEFFIALYILAKKEYSPISYISQIARLLGISKSSVKNSVDALTADNILIEKRESSHIQHPKRNFKLNLKNEYVLKLINFYERLEI